uniref:Uncharacterized protein n=1 Tax=viral metagenome TaxID=1070528 RepID=A0A6C0KEL4_9ZZZZ
MYFLYFAIYFNIWKNAPNYLDDVQFFLKVIISVILIYYYNPLYKQNITNFHKDVAFDAGIMLLLSTSLTAILNKVSDTKNRILS